MEKRRSKRKVVQLMAKRISGDEKHAVFIENISEEGMHIMIHPAKPAKDFPPGKQLEIRFKITAEETLNLQCKVRWSYRILTNGLSNIIGIEIIAPPLKYKEFVKELS
jgi:hypothetical protein